MSIKQFIQEQVLLPRLSGSGKSGVLVVYDPEQRLRDLCLELAIDRRCVVDTSESSILSREEAMMTLLDLGNPPADRTFDEMIVYVPAKRPDTDELKQVDPFSIYGVCGDIFPSGDGDEYANICLRSKPDHATEIRKIFAENANPSFAVVDAIGGGAGWPNLQATLGVESGREILYALLVPTEAQQKALKNDESWVAEAKALFQNSIGLKLLTRGKTWSTVANELWRFILFSEFVFDLPTDLPDSVGNVPRALTEARPLIDDLCDRMRSDQRAQPTYIERAESIERDLQLEAACDGIEDLGVRDTFPFEERSFFLQAVDALKRDNVDLLRDIISRHAESIWVARGENSIQWGLLQAAVSLVQSCGDVQRELPDHSGSMNALIGFYVSTAREMDRLQREFEQAASDLYAESQSIDDVVVQARSIYSRVVGELHAAFIRHLESGGWPADGQTANVDVFGRFVAPRLQESGRRVAMLLIDALRYELGVELHKQLAEDGVVEIASACAQLPTVTPIGMASLLPEAGEQLVVKNVDGKAVAHLGEKALKNVGNRLDVLRGRFGQRFAEQSLRDFAKKGATVIDTVELLVLRSNDIDEQLESTTDPGAALGLIHRSLRDIRVAINRLRKLGFHDVVIATDHGFVLNSAAEAGDVCEKPPGNWLLLHDRALLGDGSSNHANIVVPAADLGIRGDFAQVGFPRALVPYRAGVWYFHGGVSLQEALVPVITLQLQTATTDVSQQSKVTLSYKRGAKKITTRIPVVDVVVMSEELFGVGPVEMLIEAQDKAGDVVGEAKTGGIVNPATRTIDVMPGDSVKVPIRMDDAFRGKFTLKALDPSTLVTMSSIDLETEYLE
jgi:PglZ domain-containing protein